MPALTRGDAGTHYTSRAGVAQAPREETAAQGDTVPDELYSYGDWMAGGAYRMRQSGWPCSWHCVDTKEVSQATPESLIVAST
jgi:hypothetical protein